MAYKKHVELKSDKTIHLGGVDKNGNLNPAQVEGYYLGFRLISGDYGDQKLHFFQTESGNVAVWGRTKLNQILEPYAGKKVLVKFTGMSSPKKRGQRPAYLFDLEYDEEDTIPVPAHFSAESVEPIEQEIPQEAKPNGLIKDVARQAKMQEILKNKQNFPRRT